MTANKCDKCTMRENTKAKVERLIMYLKRASYSHDGCEFDKTIREGVAIGLVKDVFDINEDGDNG